MADVNQPTHAQPRRVSGLRQSHASRTSCQNTFHVDGGKSNGIIKSCIIYIHVDNVNGVKRWESESAFGVTASAPAQPAPISLRPILSNMGNKGISACARLAGETTKQ
jgi:hypothetical protein